MILFTVNVKIKTQGGLSMDETSKKQEDNKNEMDICSLEKKENDIVSEEPVKKHSSETTLIQDLLSAMGLESFNSKVSSLDAKEKKIDRSNEKLSPHLPEFNNSQLEHDSGLLLNGVHVGKIEKTSKLKKNVIIITLLIVAFILFKTVPFLFEPNPPSKNIVAVYNNKNITVEQLIEFVKLEGVKDNEHGICEKHGFDHSKCDEFEVCETHPIHSLESYQQIVKLIAVEKIIEDWANENGIIQREDVEHGLKDLVKDINIESVIDLIHQKELTPESIPKWEVQQYFNENNDTYKGRSFKDVEAEIRKILVTKKDESYFEEYIAELKQSAGLIVNFDILKVEEPTDSELQAYYEDNSSKFVIKESAEIEEIRIDKKNNTKDVLGLANDALSKLRAGESFEVVVQNYAIDGKSTMVSVRLGERGEVFDKEVFKLRENEISDVIEYDGNVYIVKMISKDDEVIKKYDDVKQEIMDILLKEKTAKQYDLLKSEALFTVHSKRYTLGEFATEFEELPMEYQTAFAGYDGKKRLLEQMIAKELLLEEYSDKTESAEDLHKIEDIKKQYLSQILHKEEIDGKLSDISDLEAETFYEKNQNNFIEPAKVKLSLIWIDQGASGEKSEQAKARASEALKTILDGTDFGEVAKQYSEDATASIGGVIDEWLSKENLPIDFSKVIFSLKVNEVSPVFSNQGGLYIVKIVEKEEERKQSFEEVEEAIKEYLLDEKHIEMEANLEKELLEKSQLTIYKKTLRALLKTGFEK
jgi:parvulin-like peptidyl-prolyl isomerase